MATREVACLNCETEIEWEEGTKEPDCPTCGEVGWVPADSDLLELDEDELDELWRAAAHDR